MSNTTPWQHALPDDSNLWTPLDHAIATVNLRGGIIACKDEEIAELKAENAALREELDELTDEATALRNNVWVAVMDGAA